MCFLHDDLDSELLLDVGGFGEGSGRKDVNAL
jgi:hypothetical protein